MCRKKPRHPSPVLTLQSSVCTVSMYCKSTTVSSCHGNTLFMICKRRTLAPAILRNMQTTNSPPIHTFAAVLVLPGQGWHTSSACNKNIERMSHTSTRPASTSHTRVTRTRWASRCGKKCGKKKHDSSTGVIVRCEKSNNSRRPVINNQ